MVDELIKEYYKKFEGLPNTNPIVRKNQINDAFEIVVLEALYGRLHGISVKNMTEKDIGVLERYIVAPPDDGIDIVVECEDLDERHYDFIQVKNSALSPLEIKTAFRYMKDTVNLYLTSPEKLKDNLKRVLSATDFGEEDKTNCRYFVVHRGSDRHYPNQKEAVETVVSSDDLESILAAKDSEIPTVPFETFTSDQFNNFMQYEEAAHTPALLLNLSGYSLALLAEKYDNTELGRSILFGQNLREGLVRSNTFEGMKNTILKKPEYFWFFNNGLTILAEDYNVKKLGQDQVDSVVLENFSIINGAQTTSALRKYYSDAKNNHDQAAIDQLKKVFVLTRILKVTDRELMSDIARFNNTQNPITTRDMASNRPEQIKLRNRLIEGKPSIFMSIRRGEKVPNAVRLQDFQKTDNEKLAQFAMAGFLRDPSSAKDKKKSLFDVDYKQDKYLVNESYHRIFDPIEGILYQKSNAEINELLFVYFLYTKASKYLLRRFSDRIENCQRSIESDPNTADNNRRQITNYERRKAITRKCVFFCMSFYYAFVSQFPDSNREYRFNDFFADSTAMDKLIKAFGDLFLNETVNLVFDMSANRVSLDDWFRGKRTDEFAAAVDMRISEKIELEEKYQDYIETYKATRIDTI